jgi:hypothetical protein
MENKIKLRKIAVSFLSQTSVEYENVLFPQILFSEIINEFLKFLSR